MNVRHRKLAIVLKEYFFGTPAVREMIKGDFDDFDPRFSEPGNAFVIDLDWRSNYS